MNSFFIYLGIIFFLNPCIGTIDFLPDFIGVLMILYGIKKLPFISDIINGVMPKLWGLFAVSILRTVSMIFSGSFGGSTHVLLTFAFSIVEGILFLLIFGALSNGLEALKIRYGTRFTSKDSALISVSSDETAPTAVKKKKLAADRYDISKYKRPICVYTVFRLFMCFLPEATELRLSNSGSVETGVEALSEFKGLLYFLILPVVCLFTIFAVVRTVRTFKFYSSDKEMIKGFDEAYECNKREFSLKHKRSTIKTAYAMFIIGAVTSLFFFVDNRDIIPKMIPAVAFAVMTGYFAKGIKEKLLGFSSCALLAVSSGLYYAFSKAYFLEFTEENSIWVDSAAALYRPLCAVSIIQSVLLLVVLLFASALLQRCVLEVIDGFDDSETKEIRMRKFKAQIIVFRIVAFLFCCAAALYAPLRPSFGLIVNFVLVLDLAFVLSAYFVDTKI